MSPTSYQAAPPRRNTINDALQVVKSRLPGKQVGFVSLPVSTNSVNKLSLYSEAFLLIGLIDFSAPFCYFLGAGEVHSHDSRRHHDHARRNRCSCGDSCHSSGRTNSPRHHTGSSNRMMAA